jgi:hypothetical protein
MHPQNRRKSKRLRVCSIPPSNDNRPLTLTPEGHAAMYPFRLTPKGLAAVLNLELQDHHAKVIARKIAGKRGLLS